MFIKLKRKRHFNKKFAIYILAIITLGISAYLLNNFFVSRNPLYISPVGKIDIDNTSLERILKQNNINYSSVIFSGNFYLINIKNNGNNGQIKLSCDKDIHEQITSLQRILRELTIEGKLFKSIDFRFSEPIIMF
jgi:hypothetical protein